MTLMISVGIQWSSIIWRHLHIYFVFFEQNLLPDGLANEAEKALCTLVCYSTDRRIRMKFIEACIENLAHNK
jgi:hypothetical protein